MNVHQRRDYASHRELTTGFKRLQQHVFSSAFYEAAWIRAGERGSGLPTLATEGAEI